MAQSLRSILSDGVPRIAVASRLELNSEQAAGVVAAGADVLEARLDLVEPGTDASLDDRLRELSAVLPVLATVRSVGQGGRWEGTPDQTLRLYRRVLPHASAVDIELGSETEAIWDDVKPHGVTTIASYHDFSGTPDLTRLRHVRSRGRAMAADYVKIAVKVRSPDDLRTLATFATEDESRDVIPIGMGAVGTPTRVFFPLICVPLCYSFVGTAFAPGQMDLPRTVQVMRTLSPTYNQHFIASRAEMGPA